jgi:predicted alpha/beta-fold hydrolase
VNDFRGLSANDKIELLVTRYGGHCAFLKNWKMESWADELIEARIVDSTGR